MHGLWRGWNPFCLVGRHIYSFNHASVHFVGLINVLQFKPGGLGTLGAEHLAWVAADLKEQSASTPIVVFAHMPLWTIYEPWGWGPSVAETSDTAKILVKDFKFNPTSLMVKAIEVAHSSSALCRVNADMPGPQ